MKLEVETVRGELMRVAEIASGLLDGEDVKQIITEQAIGHVSRPDPEFRFLSADYYDVNHGPFLRVKKLLMRIERLAGVPVNGAVWVRVPESDDVTVALHNGPHHRFYRFGTLQMAMPEALREVFANAKRVWLPADRDGHLVTVLAPIRDSLQDVVGVVELTAPTDLDAPAWS